MLQSKYGESKTIRVKPIGKESSVVTAGFAASLHERESDDYLFVDACLSKRPHLHRETITHLHGHSSHS